MLKALSIGLLGLSLVIWLLTNYKATQCVQDASINRPRSSRMHLKQGEERESVMDPPHDNDDIESIVSWLTDHIPSDVKWNESMCPAVLHTMQNIGFHDDDNDDANAAMFTVIGSINSSFEGNDFNDLSLELLGITGVVVTTIGTSTIRAKALEVSSLEQFSPAIVSLANNNFLRMDSSMMPSLVQDLNSIGIDWMGVNAKKYSIARIGDMKVGFLAFCSLPKCTDSAVGTLPYTPIKYSVKVSKESVRDLKKYGVDTIAVVMYWGSEHSYFPEETVLYVARHLAEIPEVSVVIGYHPQHAQGHAYFGDTLVLFSPGNFMIQDDSSSLCWQRVHNNQWQYSTSTDCLRVHPALRHGLLERELQTRVYKISLYKGLPPVSRYTTLKLDTSMETARLRQPVLTSDDDWTTACGDKDTNCLSCKPY